VRFREIQVHFVKVDAAGVSSPGARRTASRYDRRNRNLDSKSSGSILSGKHPHRQRRHHRNAIFIHECGVDRRAGDGEHSVLGGIA